MIRVESRTQLRMPVIVKQYLSRGRFLVLSLTALILILYVLYLCDSFKPSKQLAEKSVTLAYTLQEDVRVDVIQRKSPEKQKMFYGIMFDAGSTGSRIHVFQFIQENQDAPLKLMNETFEAIKPGLSSYRKSPDEGAKSLVPLLELAMQKVPPAKRRKTPVALKATAGLRLLPDHLADVILDKVYNLMKEYPFRTQNDSVQIMDGSDEGIFSWMTVNFLLGSLTGHNKMVAALDLGGGSTQITFVPQDPITYDRAPKDFLSQVKLFGKAYRLYTHSYLGLGLMSARFQIMGGIENPGSTEREKPESLTLTSACLPPDYRGSFEHQGAKYKVRHPSESAGGFEKCYTSVRELIVNRDYSVDKVQELADLPVYIFSYYYDRAEETGLIDSENGGEITLIDYKKKALSICDKHVEKMPYLCMDVVYIYSLLADGFGLPQDKQLILKKKIAGVEISWALGAMFDMLSLDSSETS